jgi:hypothetical protein
MSYLAIVKVENNRIAKYQDYPSKPDADAHVGEYGGFVVETPVSGGMNYWVVDEGAKTITHDSSTETADKNAYDAQAYARSRKEEYPSIPDQLDDLYHNGIDGWKATIKVTKDKYPKG